MQMEHKTIQIVGQIRKESFGGLYYDRNRLTVELLNDTAYEILNYIRQGFTIDEIIQLMITDYGKDFETQIRSDVNYYMNYLKKSRFVTKEDDKNISSLKTSKVEMPSVFQNDVQNNYTLGMPPYVLGAPLKTLLELTHNCNLKCVHCFADADFCCKTPEGYLDGEMNTEQWCQVIDKIIDAGVFEILLSGGEATMRKDLIDIARHIQERGASYCLLSNTTLIDDALAKQLKETGCVKVESNLDGYNAETYDSFRGVSGSFDATVKGIKACLRQGLPVRCNVMETKMNIFDLKKIVDTAYEIGVREVCIVPLESGGRAKTNDHLAFTKDEQETLKQFYLDIDEWFSSAYGNTDMVLLTPYALDKKSGSKFSKIFDINNFMPACGAGKIHCTIDPYGMVKLCPSDSDCLLKEQNCLLTNDLKSIWAESEVLNWVRSNVFKKCQHCADRCEYSCPVTRAALGNPKVCSNQNGGKNQ